jgi:transketolase
MFAYGPVMLHEALVASELMASRRVGLRVVNMPWLNRMDGKWLARLVSGFEHIFVVEDHAPVGGLGDHLLEELVEAGALGSRSFTKCAVVGYPAFGTPVEVLRHHHLDGASLARRVLSRMG